MTYVWICNIKTQDMASLANRDEMLGRQKSSLCQ